MASTPFETTLPVYRHASDNGGMDCGRACAQMLIASLHLGSLGSPTAAPVPVTQPQLRALETYESLHAGADGPGGWFTFPDELVALLNSSPELTALNLNHWKIVAFPALANPVQARANLLDAIAASLIAQGTPAILNLKTSDHWVLVSKVWVDSTSKKVDSIRFADPAGWPSTVTGAQHTYQDPCEKDGGIYWIEKTSAMLATLELAIGSTAPTTYKNKCIAVVYDPTASTRPLLKKALKKKSKSTSKSMLQQSAPLVLAKGAPPQQAVFADLRGIAERLGLDELGPLVEPGAQVRVWRVKDIDGSAEEYALSLVSHAQSRHVVLAACHPQTYQVSYFRLAAQDPSLDSLFSTPETETLWWTRQLEDIYWAPFFPFRREIDAAGPRYRRLVDSHYVDVTPGK